MATSIKELFNQAAELDEKDRATLAGLLLESIDRQIDPDIEAAWAAEIQKRVAQIDNEEVELVPWEGVKKKLLRD